MKAVNTYVPKKANVSNEIGLSCCYFLWFANGKRFVVQRNSECEMDAELSHSMKMSIYLLIFMIKMRVDAQAPWLYCLCVWLHIVWHCAQNTWTHVSAIHHLSSNSQNQKRKTLHINRIFFSYSPLLQLPQHPFDGDDSESDSIARWNVKHHLYIVLFYAEGIVKGCRFGEVLKVNTFARFTSNRNILRILTAYAHIHTSTWDARDT